MQEYMTVRFPSRIEIRAPKALPEALSVAASQQMTTPSEYVRRALIEKLQADGIDPLALHVAAA